MNNNPLFNNIMKNNLPPQPQRQQFQGTPGLASFAQPPQNINAPYSQNQGGLGGLATYAYSPQQGNSNQYLTSNQNLGAGGHTHAHNHQAHQPSRNMLPPRNSIQNQNIFNQQPLSPALNHPLLNALPQQQFNQNQNQRTNPIQAQANQQQLLNTIISANQQPLGGLNTPNQLNQPHSHTNYQPHNHAQPGHSHTRDSSGALGYNDLGVNRGPSSNRLSNIDLLTTGQQNNQRRMSRIDMLSDNLPQNQPSNIGPFYNNPNDQRSRGGLADFANQPSIVYPPSGLPNKKHSHSKKHDHLRSNDDSRGPRRSKRDSYGSRRSGDKRKYAIKNIAKMRKHVTQLDIDHEYYYKKLLDSVCQQTVDNFDKQNRMKKLISNYLNDEKDRKDGVPYMQGKINDLVVKYQTYTDTNEVIKEQIYDLAVEVVKIANISEIKKLQNSKFANLIKNLLDKNKSKKEAVEQIYKLEVLNGKTEEQARKIAEKHGKMLEQQKQKSETSFDSDQSMDSQVSYSQSSTGFSTKEKFKKYKKKAETKHAKRYKRYLKKQNKNYLKNPHLHAHPHHHPLQHPQVVQPHEHPHQNPQTAQPHQHKNYENQYIQQHQQPYNPYQSHYPQYRYEASEPIILKQPPQIIYEPSQPVIIKSQEHKYLEPQQVQSNPPQQVEIKISGNLGQSQGNNNGEAQTGQVQQPQMVQPQYPQSGWGGPSYGQEPDYMYQRAYGLSRKRFYKPRKYRRVHHDERCEAPMPAFEHGSYSVTRHSHACFGSRSPCRYSVVSHDCQEQCSCRCSMSRGRHERTGGSLVYLGKRKQQKTRNRREDESESESDSEVKTKKSKKTKKDKKSKSKGKDKKSKDKKNKKDSKQNKVTIVEPTPQTANPMANLFKAFNQLPQNNPQPQNQPNQTQNQPQPQQQNEDPKQMQAPLDQQNQNQNQNQSPVMSQAPQNQNIEVPTFNQQPSTEQPYQQQQQDPFQQQQDPYQQDMYQQQYQEDLQQMELQKQMHNNLLLNKQMQYNQSIELQQQQNQFIQQENDQLRQIINKLKQERNEDEEVQNKNDLIFLLQDQNEKLKHSKFAFQQQIQQQNNSLQQVNEQDRLKAKQIELHQQKIRKLEQDLLKEGQKDQNILQLNQELAKSRAINDQLAYQVHSQNDENSKLNAELKVLLNHKNDTEGQRDQLLRDLQANQNRAKNGVDSVQLDGALQDIQLLKNENQHLRTKVKTLQDQKQRLENEMFKENQDTKQVYTQLDVLTKEKELVAKDINDLRDRREALLQQVKGFDNPIQLKQQLLQYVDKKKYLELQDKNRLQVKKNVDLSAQIEELNKEKEIQSQKIASMQSQAEVQRLKQLQLENGQKNQMFIQNNIINSTLIEQNKKNQQQVNDHDQLQISLGELMLENQRLKDLLDKKQQVIENNLLQKQNNSYIQQKLNDIHNTHLESLSQNPAYQVQMDNLQSMRQDRTSMGLMPNTHHQQKRPKKQKDATKNDVQKLSSGLIFGLSGQEKPVQKRDPPVQNLKDLYKEDQVNPITSLLAAKHRKGNDPYTSGKPVIRPYQGIEEKDIKWATLGDKNKKKDEESSEECECDCSDDSSCECDCQDQNDQKQQQMLQRQQLYMQQQEQQKQYQQQLQQQQQLRMQQYQYQQYYLMMQQQQQLYQEHMMSQQQEQAQEEPLAPKKSAENSKEKRKRDRESKRSEKDKVVQKPRQNPRKAPTNVNTSPVKKRAPVQDQQVDEPQIQQAPKATQPVRVEQGAPVQQYEEPEEPVETYDAPAPQYVEQPSQYQQPAQYQQQQYQQPVPVQYQQPPQYQYQQVPQYQYVQQAIPQMLVQQSYQHYQAPVVSRREQNLERVQQERERSTSKVIYEKYDGPLQIDGGQRKPLSKSIVSQRDGHKHYITDICREGDPQYHVHLLRAEQEVLRSQSGHKAQETSDLLKGVFTKDFFDKTQSEWQKSQNMKNKTQKEASGSTLFREALLGGSSSNAKNSDIDDIVAKALQRATANIRESEKPKID